MSDRSKIEWTDATWNPVTGCTKVSAGCRNCYAERVANRFWGERKFIDVRCHPERLDQPLRWRKPRRIFVDSMGDLFHERVSSRFLSAAFAVMASAQQHTFIVLTKRPDRMRKWCALVSALDEIARDRRQGVFENCALSFGLDIGCDPDWPLPNVWLGYSASTQEDLETGIGDLLAIPAAVRILSLQPLLGPIDLTKLYGSCGYYCSEEHGHVDHQREPADWVIVGGESGPGARPCHCIWVASLVRQCQARQTPVFVEQLGTKPRGWCASELISGALVEGTDFCDIYESGEGGHCGDRCYLLKDRKCADPAEWPRPLRVRELPGGLND